MKGILVECIEDAEIINKNEKFQKGVYYTALPDEKIYVITRKHTPILFL